MAELVSVRDLLFTDCRDLRESWRRGYTESIDLVLRHHIARDPESGAVLHDGTGNGTDARKRGPYLLLVPLPDGGWRGREFRAADDRAAVERANALLPAALRAVRQRKRRG